MAVNNGGGNPNHAPAGAPGGTGGQFVSGPQAGSEQEQEQVKEKEPKKGSAKKKSKGKFKKKASAQKLVIPQDALLAMAERLKDLNSSMNVPLLSKPEEIADHIEEYFSQNVINKIDSLYGKSNRWGDNYYFNPPGKDNVYLNIFTCVCGKYRYKDNHARMITSQQFETLAQNKDRYTRVYRGFSSEGAARQKIMNSYLTSNIDSFAIYGNGVYGTNIYTSTTYEYSLRQYAGGNPSKVMHILVDRDAKTIDARTLERWQRDLFQDKYDWSTNSNIPSELKQTIVNKVETHLVNKGIEASRAKDIAKDFGNTLSRDISLIAILMGYDYQIASSDNQRNILNLGKMLIRQ